MAPNKNGEQKKKWEKGRKVGEGSQTPTKKGGKMGFATRKPTKSGYLSRASGAKDGRFANRMS